MKKLPVYILLETCGGLTGGPQRCVQNALHMMTLFLKGDQHAVNTVYLSIISYNSYAEQVVPLTDLSSFDVPKIIGHGTIALGEAIKLLYEKIDTEINDNYCAPLVFIVTYRGVSTDNWQPAAIELMKRKYFAITFFAGFQGDPDVFRHYTDMIIRIQYANADLYNALFYWITEIIIDYSKNLSLELEEVVDLHKYLPPNELEIISIR